MEDITREENSKQEIFITEADEDVDDEQRLVISDDKHTESPFSSTVRLLTSFTAMIISYVSLMVQRYLFTTDRNYSACVIMTRIYYFIKSI